MTGKVPLRRVRHACQGCTLLHICKSAQPHWGVCKNLHTMQKLSILTIKSAEIRCCANVRRRGISMNRIKNFLLCLVLLALAGILHHVWLEMSGTRIVTPASAAVLQNGSGQSCNGTGKWHFVNNQTTGACGPITATFLCGGNLVNVGPIQPTKCLTSVDQYNVTTNGSCTLVSASTALPGNLVLSDFTCSPSPTPTPTPTPSPTPSPTPV